MPRKSKIISNCELQTLTKYRRQRYFSSRVTNFHSRRLTSDQEMDRSDIRRFLESNLRRFEEHMVFSLESQIYVLFYRWCIDHSNSCKCIWIMHFRQNRISWSSNKIYFMYRYLISIGLKGLFIFILKNRKKNETKINFNIN